MKNIQQYDNDKFELHVQPTVLLDFLKYENDILNTIEPLLEYIPKKAKIIFDNNGYCYTETKNVAIKRAIGIYDGHIINIDMTKFKKTPGVLNHELCHAIDKNGTFHQKSTKKDYGEILSKHQSYLQKMEIPNLSYHSIPTEIFARQLDIWTRTFYSFPFDYCNETLGDYHAVEFYKTERDMIENYFLNQFEPFYTNLKGLPDGSNNIIQR